MLASLQQKTLTKINTIERFFLNLTNTVILESNCAEEMFTEYKSIFEMALRWCCRRVFFRTEQNSLMIQKLGLKKNQKACCQTKPKYAT